MPATATAPTASGAEVQCPENRVKALDVLSWPRVGVGRPESPDRCWENRPRYDGKTVGTALARYYDPSTGQFLTVDPKVATTLSPYGYAKGDPLNASDPGGLTNDASSGGFGNLTSGPEAGCYVNLSGGPALCPVGNGQVAPLGSGPAGGSSLAPNYASECFSAYLVEVCLTQTDRGNTYFSIGPGIGTLGPSASSGYVREGSADQMINGWSVHTGGDMWVGGGYASGGVCPLGSGPQGPYGQVGTPGGGIFWTYGWKI
jgi:RHS repeat-associated protein